MQVAHVLYDVGGNDAQQWHAQQHNGAVLRQVLYKPFCGAILRDDCLPAHVGVYGYQGKYQQHFPQHDQRHARLRAASFHTRRKAFAARPMRNSVNVVTAPLSSSANGAGGDHPSSGSQTICCREIWNVQ